MWRGGTSDTVRRRWAQNESHARAAWLLASDLAAAAVGADVRKVVQHHTGGRGRTVDDVTAKARKIACYLAMIVADADPSQLARASGLHRGTIHKHAAWVEDQRDHDEFDRLIDGLERTLWGMAARVVLRHLGELPEGEERAA